MLGFLDAKDVLSDLQKNNSPLNEQIHYISFDEQISQDALSELELHCIRLGYSFHKIKTLKTLYTSHPFFIYIVKRFNYQKQ